MTLEVKTIYDELNSKSCLLELMEVASSCTPDQIKMAIAFLEERETSRP